MLGVYTRIITLFPVLLENFDGRCIASCSIALYFATSRKGRNTAQIDSLHLLATGISFGEYLLQSVIVVTAIFTIAAIRKAE